MLGALLAALAACTPTDEPIAALTARDGAPVGLLYICRDGFSQLSVYQADSPDDALISWHVVGDAAAGVVEVPVFGPLPTGRRPATAGPAASSGAGRSRQLEDLRPGVRYVLSGDSHRGTLLVGFTTDSVERIGPEQVLEASAGTRVTWSSGRDSCE
jgi:hypothetical protein